jgi:hypothetical protein
MIKQKAHDPITQRVPDFLLATNTEAKVVTEENKHQRRLHSQRLLFNTTDNNICTRGRKKRSGAHQIGC